MLGLIQTIVESIMYIFVFLWTPVLMDAKPPLGMVFACFMVTIMIGSSTYALLLSKGKKAEGCLKITMIMLAVSMAVCSFEARPEGSLVDKSILYGAFLLLEIAIGMYFPAMSFLKSQVIPEGHRANVMNWFRVPMNMITCGALLSLHSEVFAHDKRIMFMMCLGLSILGIVICASFNRIMAKANTPHIVDLSDKNERACLLANESDETS